MWRASGTESGEVPMGQECFPPAVKMLRRRFGRPADAGGIAKCQAQIFEIGRIGFGRRRILRSDRGRVDASGVPCLRWNSSFKRLRTTRPIAQILGDGPKQFQPILAELANPCARRHQKLFGLRPNFFGKNHQKLLAAARTQQHLGKPQFGDQRAGQNFAQQADPAQTAGEERLGRLTGWQELLDTQ